MFRRQQTRSVPISERVKRLEDTSPAPASRGHAKPKSISKQWHAISIDAKPLSCALAQDFRKRRFLSREAPALPLVGCTKGASCPCTYKHHEDRRSKPRRKDGAALSSNATRQAGERRASRGRRTDD